MDDSSLAPRSERHLWNHRTVDSRESRFTYKELIQSWAELYGEDSDWFRFRVKGEAPRVGFASFIPPDAVDAARKYVATGFETLPKVLACDPARFGDSKTVVGVRQGRFYRILAKYRNLDLVQLANRLIEFIDQEQLFLGVVLHVAREANDSIPRSELRRRGIC